MLYGMSVWPDKIWSEQKLSVSSDKLLEASNQYVTCLHPGLIMLKFLSLALA